MSEGPVQILCRYRVKPGREKDFEVLLKRHGSLLLEAGLTTGEAPRLLRARDQAGNVAYVERFAWKNQDAVDAAHESPAVMELWEPVGAMCEDMEFWNVESFDA